MSFVLIPELSLTLALLSALVCSNHVWQGTFQFVFGDVMSFQVRRIQHHNVTDFIVVVVLKDVSGLEIVTNTVAFMNVFFLCD